MGARGAPYTSTKDAGKLRKSKNGAAARSGKCRNTVRHSQLFEMELQMEKYALTNMHLLNGHADMKPETGLAVLVSDGKFERILPEAEIPAGYEVKDLGGKYLLPGLINLHVHIPASGKPKKGKTDYNKIAALLRFAVVRAVVRKMCESYARQELLSGTTTIRAVGGVLDFDTCLRDRINAGKTSGPRILAANYAVSVPGGHMTGSVALPAHSPEEAAQMVENLSETKPDLIKLMITGGVLDAEIPGEPGILKMPPEYVKAACEKAHMMGYKVAAHVESTEGLKVALENGVDTIEHGGRPTDENMKMFHETGAVLVATISPVLPFSVMDQAVSGVSDMDLLNGKALFENMKACANRCLAEGITVGLGTDTGCPYITHYDMWRELVYFVKCCHVTPQFALHTATMINAEIAGISDETGSIDEGKSADFMVVEKDPLTDLTTLRKPLMVSLRGKMIEDPKVKKFPQVEEALDQLMKML